MRPDKLWHSILAGHRNVRFGDFERLLAAFGFVLDRQAGSHRIWRHPSGARMNVQEKGGQAKPYQIGQFLELVENYRLTLGD